MSATPAFELHYTDRAEINRANSQHSTGPRTETGKLRSAQNALRHGLTARTAVLASEDQAAYESHCRKFVDEHQPANATEIEPVQELADTSWRLRRIPILEAGLFAEVPSTEPLVPALASLGLHGTRLSRQLQKLASWWLLYRIPRGWARTPTDLLHEIAVTTVTRRETESVALDKLRDLPSGRLLDEKHELKKAAAILELHKQQGLPWEPADHGFVFSKDQVERCSRMMRQREARPIAWARFESPYRYSKDLTQVSA